MIPTAFGLFMGMLVWIDIMRAPSWGGLEHVARKRMIPIRLSSIITPKTFFVSIFCFVKI